MVDRTLEFLAQARGQGLPLLHAVLAVDRARPQGFLGVLTRGRFFARGTGKAEPVSGSREPGDIVVERGCYNFQGFDAFHRSSLEAQLRARGIQNLLIAGLATDLCPLRTLRSAQALALTVPGPDALRG